VSLELFCFRKNLVRVKVEWDALAEVYLLLCNLRIVDSAGKKVSIMCGVNLETVNVPRNMRGHALARVGQVLSKQGCEQI
jgi:hypothetical protein